MSRAGARAKRENRPPPPAHPSPACPLRTENLERAAEGDRRLLHCTCAWDKSAGRY